MNNKVAILGCAKNCAKYISTTINNMHRLGSLFSDYHIFIYENDSLDNTDYIIRQHGKSPKVTCKTQRFIHYKYKYRTWALAYARNYLINMLIESKFNPEYVPLIYRLYLYNPIPLNVLYTGANPFLLYFIFLIIFCMLL